jgi:hypothetical protein
MENILFMPPIAHFIAEAKEMLEMTEISNVGKTELSNLKE